MKAFFSLVFIFSVSFVLGMQAPPSPADKLEKDKKILEECKGLTHATDDDVKLLLEHGIPQTHNGKCLLACCQEKIGAIVNGKFSIDGLKAHWAKELEGDDKSIAAWNDMIKECESVNEPDICEMSAKMGDCIQKAGAKRNIDPQTGKIKPKER